MNEPSKIQRKREQLTREALGLWAKYAENYRTYPVKYEMLLEKRKRLKISPNGVRAIKKSDREAYPDIPFLKIEDVDVAEEKLNEMTIEEIKYLIGTIENLELDYTYQTYKARICDMQWQIDNYGKPRSWLSIGTNPDAIRGKANGGRKGPRGAGVIER